MIRRITAIALALAFVPFAAQADDISDDSVIEIQPQPARPAPTPPPAPPTPEPVTAPPPPYVEMQAMSIAAGIGARFGDGSLLVAGEEYRFNVRGLSVGDVGIARIFAEGHVSNLHDVADFAGRYVAVEAGAALGRGASAITMRNQHGVVITLASEIDGAQLSLGAQGFEIELE